MWTTPQHHFKFLVQLVYDVLPSPANLFIWGLVDSPACQLCQVRGSLEHVLSCCLKALGDGRYRWRHDQVLRGNSKEHLHWHQYQQATKPHHAHHHLYSIRREASAPTPTKMCPSCTTGCITQFYMSIKLDSFDRLTSDLLLLQTTDIRT